jgi:hypothetical protein
MFDYVDYQEQRKKREGFGLHTGFIPTTSRRRRKFRRTEKTDIGLCQIQRYSVKRRGHLHREGGSVNCGALSPTVSCGIGTPCLGGTKT